MELGLFKDKLTIEADVYQRTTKDLLMTKSSQGTSVPRTTPRPTSVKPQPRGGPVHHPPHRQGRLEAQQHPELHPLQNLVIDVAGETGFLNGWGAVRNTAITRMTEGYAVDIVGYEADGIFQSQEDIYYLNLAVTCCNPTPARGHQVLDSNGDGVINSDDITDIGNPWPKHILGLSNNFTYKNFYVNTITPNSVTTSTDLRTDGRALLQLPVVLDGPLDT